jgi:flagellar L-ring protein precursor FlgH
MVALAATSCAPVLDQLKEVGKEPSMGSFKVPMAESTYQPLEWPQPKEVEHHKNYSNSLWQQGATTFFKDQKARKVGDILKVMVRIQDQANLNNETRRERDSSDNTAVGAALGLSKLATGWLPGKAVPSGLIDVDSEQDTQGRGSIIRRENIQTEVAAMVTQILPNGNLVVHGDQEIRINYELRKVMVDGIVRPEDISAGNSVESNQIAQARISYGGKGQLSNIQQPRIGNQVLDIISPF